MAPRPSAEPPADADVTQHLQHLRVDRRLAARTLALYDDALKRLQRFAGDAGLGVRDVQIHHVRRWAAALHGQGLAPRSIALILSAWRGFYRRLGQDGLVALNPAESVRAPKITELTCGLASSHARLTADGVAPVSAATARTASRICQLRGRS